MGILETWYEYHNKYVGKTKPASFILNLYCRNLRNLLFTPANNNSEIVRGISDIYTNDQIPKKYGYIKKIKSFEQIMLNEETDKQKEQKEHIRTEYVDKYADHWYELVEKLKDVFSDKEIKNRFSIRAIKLYDILNTINLTDQVAGKKDLMDVLYNCTILCVTGKLSPEREELFTDDSDKEAYEEYSSIFQRYGRYSYQSDLLIKQLAETKNPYAMFTLAQMYYYGKGIAVKPDYLKVYHIYEELKRRDANGWEYPQFLWARADFIIGYYDRSGSFTDITIKELDNASWDDRFDLYESLLKDLLIAENKECGSASNLIGNIIRGEALKTADATYSNRYEAVKRILKNTGTAVSHYLRGARNGNTYSYYHLYVINRDKFIFDGPNRSKDTMDNAIKYLEESACYDNPYAINEIALFHIFGVKRQLSRKLDELKEAGDITHDEYEDLKKDISKFYDNKQDRKDLKKAYDYLIRIYDNSVNRLEFKWPVYNMIKHLYYNPEFFEICKNNDLQSIMDKINNTEEQLEDLRIALGHYNRTGGKNRNIREALNDLINELSSKYESEEKRGCNARFSEAFESIQRNK
ncbi:MAG: SEL1-like repeat protein [Lachnospiraceae bacterium]|nr:SEL1-like repeat protein [Lachnospiraceae bacterium]